MLRVLLVAVLGTTLYCCGGARPSDLGITRGRLAACPSSPNCVSSLAEDAEHHVDSFVLAAPVADAWREAQAAVDAMPRTVIVTRTPRYLHAECRSAVFRFVDDLELHLRPAQGIITVRSASRVGHSDMGVNRRRVERLRSALRERNVIR